MSEIALRDREHGLIAGVAAGMARRYGVSVALVRSGWIVAAVLTGGLAALLYPVAAVLMPSTTEEHAQGSGLTARQGRLLRAQSRRARMASVASALLWLMVAMVLGQVYLAGGFLMGGLDTLAAHEALGYVITHLYPVVVIVVALVAGLGRRFWLPMLALVLLLQVQPMLTYASAADGLGWMRALHPLNGTLILVLTVWLALTARAASRA